MGRILKVKPVQSTEKSKQVRTDIQALRGRFSLLSCFARKARITVRSVALEPNVLAAYFEG